MQKILDTRVPVFGANWVGVVCTGESTFDFCMPTWDLDFVFVLFDLILKFFCYFLIVLASRTEKVFVEGRQGICLLYDHDIKSRLYERKYCS